MRFKLIVIMVMIFCLTGCSNKEDDLDSQVFVLSEDYKELYQQEIEDTMNSFYWRYDDDSLLYFEQSIPTKENLESEAIFAASADSGFNLEKHSGKTAVVATAELVHFNGEKAGLAYYYFIKKELIGAYYTFGENNNAYSFNDRNVFLQDVEFKNYETLEPMVEFSAKRSNMPIDGFCDVGKNSLGDTLTISIEGNYIVLNKYINGFSLYKRIYVGGGGVVPISAAFYSVGRGDGLAILLGRYVYSESGEFTKGRLSSEKVIFLDENMNLTGEEIILESSDYSCVGADESSLVLAKGKNIEYVSKVNGVWTLEQQIFVDHSTYYFKKDDLDNDGINEYIISDGLDLYLYRKTDVGLNNIWKTHLSVESLTGNIYTGDLNQDGAKEIYICDLTGTSIRYVLTPNGLSSQNEDIKFGERIYAADFNNDGKDDYVKVRNFETKEQTGYIAE